jgi:hypothetical protein
MFNVVEFSFFLIENVYDHIEIIDEQPMSALFPFYVKWTFSKFLPDIFLNPIGKAPDMC